jgi:LacI family transcriptional regulator
MPPARVTLTDIAKKTGFSVMTVSYALRNHPKISDATRRRIRQAAERMGYVPDPEIVKLMTRIRLSRELPAEATVAVLDLFERRTRFNEDPYTNALIAGAEQRLQKLGYQLARFRMFEDQLTPRRITSIFRARGIQGVLLPPFPAELARCELEWSEVCAVCTEEKFHSPALHKVIPHHYNNMILLLTRLWDLGCRRPGLVTCRNSLDRDNYAWFGALYSFFEDKKKTAWVPALPVGNDPADMAAWYERHRPDAIIVTEGFLIPPFLELTGLKVPRDVGVACLASDFTAYSGVNQRPGVIGAAAADMLTAHIVRNERGVPEAAKTMMIEGEWSEAGTLQRISRTVAKKRAVSG